MDQKDERRLHDAMDFIGMRALTTAAGMIQLCNELQHAGALGEDAVGRIKDAMAREIALCRRGGFEHEFQVARERLDAIFAGQEELKRP